MGKSKGCSTNTLVIGLITNQVPPFKTLLCINGLSWKPGQHIKCDKDNRHIIWFKNLIIGSNVTAM